MKLLEDRIRNEGQYLGNGILKVDGFVNHQVDPMLMDEAGKKFDWDYYLNKHMPMAQQMLEPLGLVKLEVDKGIGTR